MLPIILATVGFGLVHSWLAGSKIKSAFRRRFGERGYHGLYRPFYNLFALLSFAPIGVLTVLYSGTLVWRVEGAAALVLAGLALVGTIGTVISLVQIDIWQFSGLAQLWAYVSGAELPLKQEPLQIRGLYRFVRHPLYFFSLLTIWCVPQITEGQLAFNLAATAYFVIGSLYEERRLVATFGADYQAYQAQVPWLIPFIPAAFPLGDVKLQVENDASVR